MVPILGNVVLRSFYALCKGQRLFADRLKGCYYDDDGPIPGKKGGCIIQGSNGLNDSSRLWLGYGTTYNSSPGINCRGVPPTYRETSKLVDRLTQQQTTFVLRV